MYTVTKISMFNLKLYRVVIASGKLLLVSYIHSIMRSKYTQGQYINLWHTLYTYINTVIVGEL